MRKRLKNALMALPAVLASAPVLAQIPTDRVGFPFHGWGWGWEHMAIGLPMMILFWGGIIFLIVLALRWMGSGSQQTAGSREGQALEILRERFARGEIDKAEFEERKRLLTD